MEKHLSEMTFPELTAEKGIRCSCGRVHRCGLKWFRAGKGVIEELPAMLECCGRKYPMLVMDPNTKKAAGDRVMQILDEAGIRYKVHVFPVKGKMEPDEYAMGSLAMAMDPECDVLLAVGSGVINDCCRVMAYASGKTSMAVCTAPSMDGYCSGSSSMILNHMKVSLYDGCPEGILADTDLLATAPDRMLQAGLGDMLAKYVAICEWRISHIVTGETYCEEIADMVRTSVKKIVAEADGLMQRRPEALTAVIEGLVLSGMAMAFAEISRPASGLEHYFSHFWEMQALQRGEDSDLHGIQVGIGTLLTIWLYEQFLKTECPDTEKARRKMSEFSNGAWEASVREIFGPMADSIFETERMTGKNLPETQKKHLEMIVSHWDEIQKIIREELPAMKTVRGIMLRCGLPVRPSQIGISHEETVNALVGSRDMRDKYMTSSLLWDLGLLDEAAEKMRKTEEIL